MIKKIPKLPDTPGVYWFKQDRGFLYIGKAASLRDRVRSYFGPELVSARGPRLIAMLRRATSIGHQKTESVFDALLLEAELIKKHLPRYNVEGKDGKSFWYVAVAKEDYPRVLLVRGKDLMAKNFPVAPTIFGPFPRAGEIKAGLTIVRKIFPFRDKCLPGARRPCFEAQIGLCPGVCIGRVSKQEYQKTIRRLTLFFRGRKVELIKSLERQMKVVAKAEDFETALKLRRQIFALKHIRDVALLQADREAIEAEERFRIEAYDVSHTAGSEAVGAMVVWENGGMKKSDYRKFKLKQGASDTANLREILMRRFRHSEWSLADLIVVDGATAQINTAKKVVGGSGLVMPVVAVTKDERHRPRNLKGERRLIGRYREAILLANSEAHRFATSFHRHRRGRVV